MNLFLPVYKRLEEDVLRIAENVFFDDRQLGVYSLSIGDLLIRCVIEVEAISKEIYLSLGGVEHPVDKNGNQRDLYFDTDCIRLLVDAWKIDKKKLQITNSNMYFGSERSVLTPLHKAHKRGTSSSRWQQAYQAFKHYRTRSIEKATIENLLNALGALYILNLYYSDESFWEETIIKGRRKYTVDSKIFSPFICDATHIHMSPEMGDNNMDAFADPTLEESIYILKNTDDAYRAIHKDFCKFNTNVVVKVQMSEEYQGYLKNHPEEEKTDIYSICQKLGINYMILFNREAKTIGNTLQRLKEKEVILNKNSNIYPTLSYADFLNSDEGQKYMKDTIDSYCGKTVTLPKSNK